MNDTTTASFDTGRAVRAATALIAREPVKILLFALLFAGLPDWATTYLTGSAGWSEQGLGETISWTGAGMLMTMVTNGALQAAVTLTAQDRLRPSAIALGLPVLALSLVTGLGILAGFVLLIIPGIILSLAWYVVVPAMVTERLGVIDAIKRSNHLTGNARGAIFGLTFAIGLGGVFIGWLAQLVAAAADNTVLTAIVTTVVQTLIGAVGAVLALAVYQDLRLSQEGTPDEALEAVFA